MREQELQAINAARQKMLRWLWPRVPAALDVLTRCAVKPCADEVLEPARDIVLRWLHYEQACALHATAQREEQSR